MGAESNSSISYCFKLCAHFLFLSQTDELNSTFDYCYFIELGHQDRDNNIITRNNYVMKLSSTVSLKNNSLSLVLLRMPMLRWLVALDYLIVPEQCFSNWKLAHYSIA